MSREFFHHRPDLAAPELLFTVAITLVIALFPLLLQATLRQRLDPNRPNPTGHPILPPGTPPALLRSPDGSFHPVPSVPLDTTSATLYAIYRPGQLVLEPLCCQCLAPSTTTYKPPLALSAGKNFLPVPLCHPCAKRLRNRTWLYFLLIAVPLSLFIAALAAVLVPGIDDIGRVILALVSGLALIVASLFAVTYATLPFRLKLIDPHRHIHRLWFQNPAYTALLIRRLAEADGHH